MHYKKIFELYAIIKRRTFPMDKMFTIHGWSLYTWFHGWCAIAAFHHTVWIIGWSDMFVGWPAIICCTKYICINDCWYVLYAYIYIYIIFLYKSITHATCMKMTCIRRCEDTLKYTNAIVPTGLLFYLIFCSNCGLIFSRSINIRNPLVQTRYLLHCYPTTFSKPLGIDKIRTNITWSSKQC